MANIDEGKYHSFTLVDEQREGPTIKYNYETRVFTLECVDTLPLFLKDSRKVLPEGTAGAANLKWIHTKVDEFLDRVLKESVNG